MGGLGYLSQQLALEVLSGDDASFCLWVVDIGKDDFVNGFPCSCCCLCCCCCGGGGGVLFLGWVGWVGWVGGGTGPLLLFFLGACNGQRRTCWAAAEEEEEEEDGKVAATRGGREAAWEGATMAAISLSLSLCSSEEEEEEEGGAHTPETCCCGLAAAAVSRLSLTLALACRLWVGGWGVGGMERADRTQVVKAAGTRGRPKEGLSRPSCPGHNLRQAPGRRARAQGGCAGALALLVVARGVAGGLS